MCTSGLSELHRITEGINDEAANKTKLGTRTMKRLQRPEAFRPAIMAQMPNGTLLPYLFRWWDVLVGSELGVTMLIPPDLAVALPCVRMD